MMKNTIKNMAAKFKAQKKDVQRENLTFITLAKEEAVPAVTYLRDYEGYRHLVLISAVDYIERNVFQLTYLLHSYRSHSDIGIRVEIDRDNPVMDSIHHLWASASVYQRELKEMFGIDFPGSPRLDEPFALEGWDAMPPMRRDFDTKKYSQETYFPREGRKTFDPKTVMERKLYPTETEVKYEIKKIVRDNRNK